MGSCLIILLFSSFAVMVEFLRVKVSVHSCIFDDIVMNKVVKERRTKNCMVLCESRQE